MMILSPYRYAASGGPTDPDFASVVSLLHFNGTDGSTTFTDVKGKTWTSSNAATARLSTADSKFGTASLLLSGGNISTPDSADWHFGSGDFTIECWVKPTTLTQTGGIVAQWDGGGGGRSFILFHVNSNFQFSYSTNGTSFTNAFAAAAGWSTSAWQHIAVSCNSGTIRGYVNGVQVGTNHTRVGALFDSFRALGVGDNSSGGTSYQGRVDDLRITKGVGRYPAAFTPPTAAFPDS